MCPVRFCGYQGFVRDHFEWAKAESTRGEPRSYSTTFAPLSQC